MMRLGGVWRSSRWRPGEEERRRGEKYETRRRRMFVFKDDGGQRKGEHAGCDGCVVDVGWMCVELVVFEGFPRSPQQPAVPESIRASEAAWPHATKTNVSVSRTLSNMTCWRLN